MYYWLKSSFRAAFVPFAGFYSALTLTLNVIIKLKKECVLSGAYFQPVFRRSALYRSVGTHITPVLSFLVCTSRMN